MKRLLLFSLALAGFSLQAQSLQNSNTALPAVCGGTFVDSGGASGNYSDNENLITTICPENPGDVVKVTFLEFSTEANYDALYVFNGNSTSAPMIASANGAGSVPGLLAGGYWGSAIPGPFTSSTPDGCLTFQFRSGSSGVSGGWLANVTCSPTENCVPPILYSAVADGTSALLTWEIMDFSSTWEVVAQPCGSPAPGNGPASGGIVTNTLPFEVTNLIPGTCYDFYVRSLCGVGDGSGWSNSVSATTGQGAAIVLKPFVDANANGIFDAGETLFNKGSFSIDNGSQTLSMNSGSGILVFDTPGFSFGATFSIWPEFASYFSLSTATYANLVVGNSLQTYYFPIQNTAPLTNMSVVVYGSNPPRPNSNYSNYVVVRNDGTSTQTATLDFSKDAVLGALTANQPITPTAQGFAKTVTLAPNEVLPIVVNMQVPDVPAVNAGDLVTNSAVLSGVANSVFPDALHATHSAVVVNSYDPNDIAESHGPEIDLDEFTADDYLYYTIRFQNTGTAEALNIRIENTLDAQLDAGSFRVVAASHNYTTTRNANGLVFNFNDINLTWQSQNEALSQGWILYKIKANAGFEAGDTIPNAAEIYFDSNPAIVTDTFETHFVNALGVDHHSVSQAKVYPVPVSDKLNIDLANGNDSIKKVEVVGILGNVIFTSEADGQSLSIDALGWKTGIYMLRILTDSGDVIHRKIAKK